MSLHYGELRPTNGWDGCGSLEHPSKFQLVSRLGFITAATSLTGGQPNFAQCLAVSWAGTLYIHFRGPLCPKGILIGAKFTLHVQVCQSSVVPFLVPRRKVWLTPTTWMSCYNVANIGKRKSWTYKVNFPPSKIPLGGKSPRKCI